MTTARRGWLGIVLLTAACTASDDIPAPLVAGVSPNHGLPGALVTVTGDYFCQRPNTGNEDPTCAAIGTVEFGSSPGATSSWSDVAIMVEVPSLAPGPVDVVVVAAGRASNSVTFTAE